MSGTLDTTGSQEERAVGSAQNLPIETLPAAQVSPTVLNRPNGPQPSTSHHEQAFRLTVADVGSDTPAWAPTADPHVLSSVLEAAAREPPAALEIVSGSRFVREQEWLGRVDDVGEEHILATLTDMMGSSGEEESTEISWQLVADQDVELVTAGALFYLVVGYRITARERRGESRLIFKRALPWTESEQRRARAVGDQLWQGFALSRDL
jgi:hypothetical protein